MEAAAVAASFISRASLNGGSRSGGFLHFTRVAYGPKLPYQTLTVVSAFGSKAETHFCDPYQTLGEATER